VVLPQRTSVLRLKAVLRTSASIVRRAARIVDCHSNQNFKQDFKQSDR